MRLFRSLEFHGLGYLEVKRDAASGTFRMIEANIGRPTGRSATAEAGGVELLATMYCDAAGLPLPARREQRYVGAAWIDLRRDLLSAAYHWRREELRPVDRLRSLRARDEAFSPRRGRLTRTGPVPGRAARDAGPYPPKRAESASTLSTYCLVSSNMPRDRTDDRPW